MSKPWVGMNREELLVEKGAWEGRLQTLNLELKTAKRRAAATREFLPIDVLQDMEERRLRLVAGVRGLQTELAKRHPQVRPQRSFNDYFFDEADAFLADDVFNDVYDRAEARMKLERGR